jgi:membrane protein CcdC involved in cytochrome C biogenesis
MAKAKQKSVASIKTKRLKSEQSHLHFAMTAKNYSIIGLGILVIIIGYFLMNANSVDGFMPTVVAPILLVLGYCLIIPFGILYTDKVSEVTEKIEHVHVKDETISVPKTVSSNVKAG